MLVQKQDLSGFKSSLHYILSSSDSGQVISSQMPQFLSVKICSLTLVQTVTSTLDYSNSILRGLLTASLALLQSSLLSAASSFLKHRSHHVTPYFKSFFKRMFKLLNNAHKAFKIWSLLNTNHSLLFPSSVCHMQTTLN